MKRGPSRLLEWIVKLFLPPRQREHVLGDLYERYRNPFQYTAEAMHTVPCVVLSQIRRSLDVQVLLMEAFAMYVSFLASAWLLDRSGFLYEHSGFLRLAIPTAFGLIGLVLGDAYAGSERKAVRDAARETLLAVAMAYLCQAALLATRPEVSVPRWIMVSGALMSFLLVSTLRALFPPPGTPPHRPV